MLVIAHAGHWLAQLAYLLPLILLVVAFLWGKVRDRARNGDRPPDRPSRRSR